MKIENLKEFKALVKACRDLGVSSIDLGDISIRLGPMPIIKIKTERGELQTELSPEAELKVPQFNGEVIAPDIVPTEELTEEQLMFYSAQGHEQVEQ